LTIDLRFAVFLAKKNGHMASHKDEEIGAA